MNIFATVGTQLPFDRLIRCLDVWNAANTTANVFAQIGKGAYTPANLEWVERVTPTECKERFVWADLIVAHAGIGTLLAAHAAQKPLVVLPRLAHLGEHRNDHQVATARRLEAKEFAHVAHDEKA